jgi:hypothetical protein
VRLVDGREAFLAALDDAIHDNAPGAAEARIAAVADQTWDARVASVLADVAARLSEHSSSAVQP